MCEAIFALAAKSVGIEQLSDRFMRYFWCILFLSEFGSDLKSRKGAFCIKGSFGKWYKRLWVFTKS